MNEPIKNCAPLRETLSLPKSFETSQGSIYRYDTDGKTSRFKTATGEQIERQNITVFADLTPDEDQFLLNAYRHLDEKYRNLKIYVGQKERNNTGVHFLFDVEEIQDPKNLCLVVFDKRERKIIWYKDASLQPKVGSNVFDMRRFEQDGQTHTQRHIGHKVIKINY